MKTRKIFITAIIALIGIHITYCQTDENLVTLLNKHDDAVNALTFTSNGKYLATGGKDKAIYIWDMETEEIVYSITDNYFPVKAHEFLNPAELLVTSGPDIKLIDIEGKLLHAYKGYTTHIWSFDYNSKTQQLIAGSYSAKVNIWNKNTGDIITTLEGHEKSSLAVGLSPDGKLAVTGSLDRSVRLWEIGTGKELLKLNRHSDNIMVVKFHPSGKYFASASLDKTIRLWNTETGELIKTYPGHIKGVMDIDFSPDGYYLTSASLDKTIILWETFTGNKLYSFVDHKGPVNVVRFSPDGNYLASGSEDKSIMIWKLNKSIFATYYFQEQIDEEIGQSDLFGPKRKVESKQEFIERQQKAETTLSEIYDRYFNDYLKIRNSQPVEE